MSPVLRSYFKIKRHHQKKSAGARTRARSFPSVVIMRRVVALLLLLHCLLVSSEDVVKPKGGEKNDAAVEVEANVIEAKEDRIPEHLIKKKDVNTDDAQQEMQENTNDADKDTNSVHDKSETNNENKKDSSLSESLLAEQRRVFEEMDGNLDDFKLGEHGELEGLFKDSFDPYREDLQGDEPEIEHYDFDPSEGLSFVVHEGTMECFYETVKDADDHVSGAYIVSAADSKIDLTIRDPNEVIVIRRYGEIEDEYDVTDTDPGDYEICFSNINYSGDKLVTHVTHTLRSQHPVEKEHVSHLAEYAAHLDIKLGEFESEQRLLQIRTDRHIKSKSMLAHSTFSNAI